METYFEKQTQALYTEAIELLKETEKEIPEDFRKAFFKLIDQVNMSLMEEKNDFYSYFLIQMDREIRLDLEYYTGVNFKGAHYVIYFNPLLFLNLTLEQMKSSIKHEIHHILSLHLVRAKELKEKYSSLAIDRAMDIVVNQYLKDLPPYATTLEQINVKYDLKLKPYEPFEYYVEKLQIEIDLSEQTEEEDMHAIWEESEVLDEKLLRDFTEKFVEASQKGKVPTYLEGLLNGLKKNKEELPWQLYLKQLMGTVEGHKKKTRMRRSRRQPDRLDLRGELRAHRAEIAVALDISGSMSDEEFKQAIKEVLGIVRSVNYEITVLECDDQIRRIYKVKSEKDLKERNPIRGGTKFTPVFDYANQHKINVLIYFTDGKGEEKLEIVPRGYRVLWIISGRGDKLSLKEPYGKVKKLSQIAVKEVYLDMNDVRADGYSMNNQAPGIL
ncbi:hypothetical protein CS063_06735 [Sporanaerobium hydrogeniformans]|uniref:Uncharacterized protein n=1 Tax=Sporanaerobium hydrogeniformans TaxID=3072179 RepID=A0AC61DCV6_9FIRM|nr:VWA-like domain-containing protein [Sporanaerobium hydrogeniformans]PHV71026.1 hypothetical protein CS063_06735 [Sporanaerobium hydrogeniformans]